MIAMPEIKHEYGHYAVYIDGVFYCSADTYSEAREEVKNVSLSGDYESGNKSDS